MASFRLEYGDPHEDGVEKPFDAFVMDGEAVHPGEVFVPRFLVRGILAAWGRTSPGGADRIVGARLRYEYFSTGDTAFGGQGLEVGRPMERSVAPPLRGLDDPDVGILVAMPALRRPRTAPGGVEEPTPRRPRDSCPTRRRRRRCGSRRPFPRSTPTDGHRRALARRVLRCIARSPKRARKRER